MAKPFETLPQVTSQMASRLDTAVSKLVRGAALEAGRVAVQTTRVDTGRARSNWRANKNAPASGVIPAYAPGNKLGFGERANSIAAQAQQRVVIRSFNVQKDSAVYISNNTPYIALLNNGGPNVSPGNMAQLAVQAARAAVTGDKLLNTLVPKGAKGFRSRG